VLALPVVFSGDIVQDGSGDHRIWFIGEQTCDQHGRPIPGPSPEAHAITPELSANFMISSKPKNGGVYANTHDKITSYVRILSHPAKAIDPTVKATPGAGWTEVPDDLPFVYPDTGTARAGLAEMNGKFRGHRIGIIGLGGTAASSSTRCPRLGWTLSSCSTATCSTTTMPTVLQALLTSRT
jgi:hypothetical protein